MTRGLSLPVAGAEQTREFERRRRRDGPGGFRRHIDRPGLALEWRGALADFAEILVVHRHASLAGNKDEAGLACRIFTFRGFT